MSEIRIVQLEEKYCKPLEALQRKCFPTLGEQELLHVEHFRSHLKLFPEGNFVALIDQTVVGLGSGFLTNFDFDHPNHTFQEMIAGGYYTNHDPNGEWYYGADISVHPEYRGRGIGRNLYAARKNLVRRYNKKGIVAGGLLPDFVDHKHKMTVQEYVDKVIAGELRDPTLSFQLEQGFKVRGLLKDYLDDAASDNWATLIVWESC